MTQSILYLILCYLPDIMVVLCEIRSTSLMLRLLMSLTALIQPLRRRISFYDLVIQTKLAMALTIPESLTSMEYRLDKFLHVTGSLLDLVLRLCLAVNLNLMISETVALVVDQ